MSKFNDFVSKLKDTKTTKKQDSDEELEDVQQFEQKQASKRLSWMSKQVHFHIDSERAYNVTKAKEFEQTIGTGKNFEDFRDKH